MAERFAFSLARAGEWLNPIVVKEVRQGLRARTFSVAFSLLLIVAVVASLVAWNAYEPGTSGVGMTMFGFCFGAYALVGFLVLPMTLFRGFVRERESETWPLVVMTGLPPRRVLRGKIASSLVQGALYASAISPFLFFSYFLEGISLAAILVAMAGALVYQAFLTTVAASVATFGETRFFRALVSAAFAVSLVVVAIYLGAAGTLWLADAGFAAIRGPTTDLVVLWLFVQVTLAFVFFEVAAARLMSAGENHAFGPRLAALTHLALGGLLVHLFARGEPDLPMTYLVYGTVFTFAFGLFAATEDDGASRGVRSRWHFGPLLPGAKRGLVATLVLEAVVVACYASCPHARLGANAIGLPIALVGYVALPIALGRGALFNLVGAPARLRLFAIAIFLTGFLLVPTFSGWDEGGLNGLVNPFLANSQTPSVLGACAVGAILVIAFVVLRRRELGAEKP